MLRKLQVNNYVLIDSLEIEFPEGLVIITGQTGAGKSIILGALSLLTGAKADVSAIGDSADNCVVEACFEVDPEDGRLQRLAEENDVEWDAGRLLIRRVLSKSGRTRSFVNDCPVNVQFLSQLSSGLIDIHSQHQTRMLSDRRFQMSVLDTYAEDAGLLREYASCYKKFKACEAELAALDAAAADYAKEREYCTARFSKLDSAGLRDGELAELEEEQKQLANAEEIKELLCGSEAVFDDINGTSSLDSVLKDVEKKMDRLSAYVQSAGDLSERLSSCRIELDDIRSEISHMNSSLNVSPERLQVVEDRISLIYGLMNAFSCRTEAQLLAERDSLAEKLASGEAFGARREELAALLETLREKVGSSAAALHEARVVAAAGLSQKVTESLRFLELQNAVFNVKITAAALSSDGADDICFEFSSTGKDPLDISRCASGGELSRIMLTLKSFMSRHTKMPTMIFDEIDTGVSGSAADKMGSVICEMGNYMQVFAITHLPQVAAKGEAHYLVSKTVSPDGAKTVSTISRISGEQRIMEVARMLSGSELTPAAVANARSLLSM